MAFSASETSIPGETYAFYMALTDAILALVTRAREGDPQQLYYDGLDLSHAFEATLYFVCVHDAGLRMLFNDPGNVSAAAHLGSPMARLIAEQGFARGKALDAVRRRNKWLRLARAVKRAVTPSRRGVPSMQDGIAPPILFLTRSPRFARFLRPLAQALGKECGFLVPAGETELAALVQQWGFSCHRYAPGQQPRGFMGGLIQDCGRDLACVAQTFGDVMARLRPKLVVVPEGNTPEDEILARIAQRHGIASACVQQGWSPILHPAFHNLNYGAMLVWGQGFADLLAPANPQQRFIATGNFHLSEALDRTGQGVLFLLQGFDNWLGGRKGANDMLTLIEGLAATLPNQAVFVRPHPVVPLPEDVRTRLALHPNIRIENSADVPLAEAFAKSCVSVSAYSTTILESIAAGVVPLIFNTIGIPRFWPDVAAAGAGLEIREPEAALQALLVLVKDAAALAAFRAPMEVFAKRFFLLRGTPAIASTAATLRRLATLE